TFRRSLDGLGISATAVQGRSLIVAEIALQQLPPNILLIGSDPDAASFAGAHVPMASIPSLSWLRAARRIQRPPAGRRVAWISTATRDDSGGGTLEMLASR